MAYSIRLPDGTLVENIPDDLSPEEAKKRIVKAFPQFAPPTSTTRRVLGDVPVGIAQGATTGVRMIADAFGADNVVSQNLKGVEEYLGGLLSAQATNNLDAMAKILKEAEDKGILEQVKAGFRGLAEAPVEVVSQFLGTAAPTILAGVGGALARLGAVGIGTMQAGTGAAMGAGLIKGNIRSSGTHRAQHLQPSAPWQAQIQQHGVEGLGGRHREGGLTIAHPVRGQALLAQRRPQRFAHHLVVLDQQDAHGRKPGLRSRQPSNRSPTACVPLGGVNPRCRHASSVAMRPRGVRCR